jgi:hypothetical protein
MGSGVKLMELPLLLFIAVVFVSALTGFMLAVLLSASRLAEETEYYTRIILFKESVIKDLEEQLEQQKQTELRKARAFNSEV